MFEGHSKRFSTIHFSQDSTRLALASHDNIAKIWDPSIGVYLWTLNTGKFVIEMSLNSTGSYLDIETGSFSRGSAS